MLRKATDLIGYTIQATDGEIGSVRTIWFDDEHWTVRYFVVDTGRWLPGRKVLISPIFVRGLNASSRSFDVSLTREQVKNSPDIDTHRPVSRQHEADYYAYYGYPYYWGGAGPWGAGGFPLSLVHTDMPSDLQESQPRQEARSTQDSHLRDIQAVKGYHLRATDGEIGHVQDFIADDTSWAIRYLIVDTSNWLGGRHVLVAPAWVREVSWDQATVDVTITREAVRNSPEYVDGTEVDHDYEQGLYAHYGQTGYWAERPERPQRTEGGQTLARLEDCDELELADGEPDVLGWKVKAADGAAVGTVEHLIVDRPSLKARYLEVGLEQQAVPGSEDVLIPLEHVELDESAEEVRLPTLPAARVSQLPVFKGLPLDPGYADRLQRSFGANRESDAPREPRLDAEDPSGSSR